MDLWGDASPDVRNCVFTNCSVRAGHGGDGGTCTGAGDGGWGGYARGGAVNIGQGNPIFTNCKFLNNTATGGDGGNGSNDPDGIAGSWDMPEGDPPWLVWHYADGLGENGGYMDTWKYSGYGGAVYCETGGSSEFVNCEFRGNRAYGGSTGISGEPVIPQTHQKLDRFGGAVYGEADCSVKFTDCIFIDNEADTQGPATHKDGTATGIVDPYYSIGGAVAFENGSMPIFENCSFDDNRAHIAGAIYTADSNTTIIDCNIANNTAYHGAGAYLITGNINILNSNFTNNTATSDANGQTLISEGGGLYCFDANAMIYDSTITDNTAQGSGGGLFISGSDNVLLKNCLIARNSSWRDGGGVSANWHSQLYLQNCTVANNYTTGHNFEAGYGGGIYACYESYVELLNSILWSNTAENGYQIAIGTGFEFDQRPAEVSVSYSDIQSGAVGIYKDDNCILQWDYASNMTGNSTSNPLFIGDYYLSQLLDANEPNLSPAVDFGSDTPLNLDLYKHTTRTDGLLDINTVDIGYHHTKYMDIIGDFNFDGIVNFEDLALFYTMWLQDDCRFPDYCHERDINKDGQVDNTDFAIFSEYFGGIEMAPPKPDPMQWATPPTPADGNTISMVAVRAVDNSGFDVEYYFQRTDANGTPDGTVSGWKPDRIFEDPTALAGTEYGYRVKARDVKDPNDPNLSAETDYSIIGYAIAGQSDGGGAPTHRTPTR